ncbi:hypothetical protein ABVT39_024233 [Epinephelus coioides]
MERHLVLRTPNALSTTHRALDSLALYLPSTTLRTGSLKGVNRRIGSAKHGYHPRSDTIQEVGTAGAHRRGCSSGPWHHAHSQGSPPPCPGNDPCGRRLPGTGWSGTASC